MNLRLARIATWIYVAITVWTLAAVAGVHAQTPVPVAVVEAAAPIETGMRINPAAELDTTQVIDNRDDIRPLTVLYPVRYDDVSPAVWAQMIAMGYIGDPTDGTDDVIYAPRGVAGALNRIHDGLNR